MRILSAILVCLGFLIQAGWADSRISPFTAFNLQTNQSRSGLFTILGPKISSKSLYFNNFMGNRPVKLDPALMAVSCEQIKELLLTELGYNLRQQMVALRQKQPLGKIFVVLHPEPDQPIQFSVLPGVAGASYRVDMPSEMFASRMIETMVQILLIDMANARNNGPTVYPPTWLSEGLVAHLQAIGLETLPLEAGLPVTKVKIHKEAVADVRERLHEHAPLTFEELSWPEKLSKERRGLFPDSSQLFVYELLRLKNGRASLRQMIDTLPRYKNWQFAFLESFSSHFHQIVETEKWWALTLVNFTGRDPQQLWSKTESEKKLAATLRISAQVHVSKDVLPSRKELTLQKVIADWDFTRQQLVLQRTIGQLRILRTRIALDLLEVVDDYRGTLEQYLAEGRPGEKDKKISRSAAALRKSACKRLDEIDKRFASVRTPPTTAPKPAPVAPTLSSASAK